METTARKIESRLNAELHPSYLEVLDDSGRHAGHAGARSGGGHYQVVVVAECFSGKSMIEQHRLVHEALRDLFPSEVHALALKTFEPKDWKGP